MANAIHTSLILSVEHVSYFHRSQNCCDLSDSKERSPTSTLKQV